MDDIKKLKSVFYGMKNRCYGKGNSPAHLYYRDKGIKICDEWLNDVNSFVSWALENGFKDGLTIDRIDPDGDYEPSNCRWVTLRDNIVHATAISERPYYVVFGFFDKEEKRWKPVEICSDAMTLENAIATAKQKRRTLALELWAFDWFDPSIEPRAGSPISRHCDWYRVSNTRHLDWPKAKFMYI